MDKNTQTRLTARARIMKAMAHPSRLFMVEQLADKERTVGELTAMIGDDMSTVSKHLSVLKNIGIVEDEKRGALVYYRLTCHCVMKFFTCAEAVIKSSPRAGI